MRSKINFKLNAEETVLFDSFCQQVGMDRKEVAKKALFMVMNQAYDKARKLQEEAQNASKSGDTGRDMETTSVDSEVNNSNLSAEQTQISSNAS